jgi:hypothetical protein
MIRSKPYIQTQLQTLLYYMQDDRFHFSLFRAIVISLNLVLMLCLGHQINYLFAEDDFSDTFKIQGQNITYVKEDPFGGGM